MPFEKGQKKTPGSGKKKGTKNNNPFEALTLARKLNIDPLEVLLKLAAGDYRALGYKEEMRTIGITEGGSIEDYTIPVAVRRQAAKDAADKMYPSLKSTEHSLLAGNEPSPKAVVTYTTSWRELPEDDSEPAAIPANKGPA